MDINATRDQASQDQQHSLHQGINSLKDPESEHVPSPSVSPSGATESQHVQRSTVSPSGGPKKERGRHLLSGIISVNILILGCALVSAFNQAAISSVGLQIFLLVLVIATTLWMLYYTICTSRGHRAILYKDSHAGPVWLRGGLVLFGLCSLILDIFKIAKYVGYLHCDSAVDIVFLVVQALFTMVQTYFLWVHAKDCVQLQKNLTRCGLMLTLSTNLVLWMAAVNEESALRLHPNVTKSSPRTMVNRASYGDDKCKCSHSACGIFEKADYYLYPFNIEYSLFASAMAYVMWKNVGRMVEHNPLHKHHFSVKHMFLGPAAGVVLVLAGLATFVLYEVEVVTEDQGKRDTALTMYYVMTLAAATLMSLCTVVGCAIYRLEQRDHVLVKSPTRSLDVGLLIGASLGQFVIDYFIIVAVVATGAKDYLSVLSLAACLLTVVQISMQNFFIVKGLHREPFRRARQAVFTNPNVLEDTENGIDNRNNLSLNPNNVDTNFSLVLTTRNPIVQTASSQHRLNWRRRVLKEICAFLLLGNIILWIMPAFGARPQFDHTIGTEFYKFTLWTAVVNIGLPFGIFYRMHSVATLFEVFLNS